MKVETLEALGTHLTTREQLASGRPIRHRPIEQFDLKDFDDRYLPVRESANYRQRGNRIGHLWMASLDKLIAFESLLEKSILMDLDRNPSVKRVWSQPFRVDGFDENRGGRYVYPTPDLLIEHKDGTLEVAEVKPSASVSHPDPDEYRDRPEALDKAIRSWTRLQNKMNYLEAELSRINMTVTVRTELTPVRRNNLEYMSLYRRPFPKHDDLPGKVMEQAKQGPVDNANSEPCSTRSHRSQPNSAPAQRASPRRNKRSRSQFSARTATYISNCPT